MAVARPGEAVIGVDPSTGEQRWQSDVVAPPPAGPIRRPRCSVLTMVGGEDAIYLSAVDSSGAAVQQVLHAIDATTGRTRWTYEPAACDPATPPTLAPGGPPVLGCAGSPLDPVVAGAVYLGDVAMVRALDVASGAEVWATPLGSFTAGLSAGPSVVAVQLPPDGSNPDGSPLPGELVALAPADGAVMWRRPFGGYGRSQRASWLRPSTRARWRRGPTSRCSRRAPA